MLVRAYHHTYGLPTVITNCSNNYGPYQFPEKLIPVVIQSVLARKPVPVYGDGMNVRDWLYVRDHAEALWLVLTRGRAGETYNIGGHNEWANLHIVQLICDLIDEMAPQLGGNSRKLITFVKDRPGHDRRYAIDATKIEKELGWLPAHKFEQGIRETVRWYLDNQEWVRSVLKRVEERYAHRDSSLRDEVLLRSGPDAGAGAVDLPLPGGQRLLRSSVGRVLVSGGVHGDDPVGGH